MVRRLIDHVRGLWPGAGIAWPVPFLAYVAFAVAKGAARWEHAAIAVVVPTLAYTGPRTKRLFLGLLPIGFISLLYDGMRYVADVGLTDGRVHICDLRALDARLFGVTVQGVKESLPDFFRPHATTALDLLCAVPYGTFIYVTLAVSVWLYFRDNEAFRRFGWTFLCLNVAGFLTYHIYPAAPPWYVQSHGCALDLSAHANEGPSLAHVDRLLGFGYFHGFYGRSSDVFGAVPSLHVAYPLFNLLYGWKHWRALGRSLAVGFFLLMCFSAVYLSHHWVVDVLLGITYTITIETVVKRLWTRRARRAALAEAT